MTGIAVRPRARIEAESRRRGRKTVVAGCLLYAWGDEASPALRLALADDAWRVREMGAKVVARYRIEAFGPIVAGLRDDPMPRVRTAAARALARLAAPRRQAQSGPAR